MKNTWNLTSEELDKIPNFLSGLPTDPARRAGALDAWRKGGPKGLNDWRISTAPQKPLKRKEEPYHGLF
jgi:hypothetical protein